MFYYYTNKTKEIGEYTYTDEGIKINLPGVGKGNIKSYIINDQELVVEWSRDKEKGKKVFTIPKIDKVEAKYEDGVLYLNLYEKEDQIKNIEIK